MFGESRETGLDLMVLVVVNGHVDVEEDGRFRGGGSRFGWVFLSVWVGKGSRCGCSTVVVVVVLGFFVGVATGVVVVVVRFVGGVVVVCWLAVLVALVVVVETGWAAVRVSGGHGRGGGWVVFWTVVVVFSLGLVGRVGFFCVFFVFFFDVCGIFVVLVVVGFFMGGSFGWVDGTAVRGDGNGGDLHLGCSDRFGRAWS